MRLLVHKRSKIYLMRIEKKFYFFFSAIWKSFEFQKCFSSLERNLHYGLEERFLMITWPFLLQNILFNVWFIVLGKVIQKIYCVGKSDTKDIPTIAVANGIQLAQLKVHPVLFLHPCKQAVFTRLHAGRCVEELSGLIKLTAKHHLFVYEFTNQWAHSKIVHVLSLLPVIGSPFGQWGKQRCM